MKCKNGMKKLLAKWGICLCLGLTAVTAASEQNLLVAEAHSGRTDAQGGHKDNKNKSGLGSYHYHCGGYGPHLHTNGVCPYSSAADQKKTVKETVPAKTVIETVAETAAETPADQNNYYGWRKNDTGWWYELEDGSYYKDCWASIDEKWYCFNGDGYMRTGWIEEGSGADCRRYYCHEDGSMATGEAVIDGLHCRFDQSGALIE